MTNKEPQTLPLEVGNPKLAEPEFSPFAKGVVIGQSNSPKQPKTGWSACWELAGHIGPAPQPWGKSAVIDQESAPPPVDQGPKPL